MFIDKEREKKFVDEIGYIGNYDLLACFSVSIKKNEEASAFVFNHNHKQYIITCAHVVSRKSRFKKRVVTLRRQNEDIVFEGNIYYHPNKNVDLCVIEVPKNIFFECAIENRKGSLNIGQKYYISGFPSLMDSGIALGNQGDAQSLPIVREGILSSVIVRNQVFGLLLDFKALPGFSGSPVFSISKKGYISVVGVAVGAILDSNKKESNDQYDSELNTTNFTLAVPFEYAIEIIENIDVY